MSTIFVDFLNRPQPNTTVAYEEWLEYLYTRVNLSTGIIIDNGTPAQVRSVLNTINAMFILHARYMNWVSKPTAIETILFKEVITSGALYLTTYCTGITRITVTCEKIFFDKVNMYKTEGIKAVKESLLCKHRTASTLWSHLS